MKNKFFKKAIVLMTAFILLSIVVNTNVQASSVIKSQILRASVVFVDYDYGNGDPNDDDNNDQIDATHKKTIQAGINAVDENGTVYVWDVSSPPGEYCENVNINKALTLMPLTHMPPYVYIDGQNADHTITINADYVTIINGPSATFWIKNGFDGIHSQGHNKIDIMGNVIDGNNEEGIDFRNCGTASAAIRITKNKIDNNQWNGVFLNNSQYITINSNPSITGNGIGGTNRYTRSNIMLEKCKWVTISDNPQVKNSNFVGIFIVRESENITVSNNTIQNSGDDGIDCKFNPYGVDNTNWPNNIKIMDNTITQSTDEQIHIYSGFNILIQKNIIQDGGLTGITIDTKPGVNIKILDNTIERNGQTGPDWFAGILICNGDSVSIVNNTIKDNEGEGIYISRDVTNPNNYHLIEKNTIQGNRWDGISIKDNTSNYNIIRNNTIIGNGFASDYFGINISTASNNNYIYHNNFINNNKQANDRGNDYWDNGYPNCGNYWSDFDEPSEGANDTYHGANQDKSSKDGVVDKDGTAGGLNLYYIPGGTNSDKYPVTQQNGWINKVPSKPTINGPNSGKPGKKYEYKVTATDPEVYSLYYYVDWGDTTNSGWVGPYTSGTQITLNHTWSKKGTYTIKVRAQDTRQALSEWSTLEVKMPKNRAFQSMRLIDFLKEIIKNIRARFNHL